MTLLVAKEMTPGSGRWEKVGIVLASADARRFRFPKCLQGQVGAAFAKSMARSHAADSAIVGQQFAAGLTAYRVDLV